VGRSTLRLSQTLPSTPGQNDKQLMAIPIRFALFDPARGTHDGEQLHILTQAHEELHFNGHEHPPILSINRGFAAPVIIDAQRSSADLGFLSAHDDDAFGRYEAMQQLMLDTLVERATRGKADHGPIIDAVRNTLANNALETALIGEAVLLPSEAFIGDQMLVVEPDAIHDAREALRHDIGHALADDWRGAYAANAAQSFTVSPAAKGKRRLRNVALAYIMAAGASDAGALAATQFDAADNMTDRLAALQTLVSSDAPERTTVLAAFYDRYAHDPLVIDKWFSAQAMAARPDTAAAVAALKDHPDFTLANPNRVRALYGGFGANQWAFNRETGEGYDMLTDLIIALDPINPQTAARMIAPFGRWKRFGATRQTLMRAALQRILNAPGLSKDVFEQASKSLG
jgi:aminopeptidase N